MGRANGRTLRQEAAAVVQPGGKGGLNWGERQWEGQKETDGNDATDKSDTWQYIEREK